MTKKNPPKHHDGCSGDDASAADAVLALRRRSGLGREDGRIHTETLGDFRQRDFDFLLIESVQLAGAITDQERVGGITDRQRVDRGAIAGGTVAMGPVTTSQLFDLASRHRDRRGADRDAERRRTVRKGLDGTTVTLLSLLLHW